MITERGALLRSLAVGDIFHAESDNGASLICLATLVGEAVIEARTVTTQIRIRFDRQNGEAVWGDKNVPCLIDSVASLPVEIRNAILGLDRKFRLERDPERLKLSDVEKKALIFVDTYYAANQI